MFAPHQQTTATVSTSHSDPRRHTPRNCVRRYIVQPSIPCSHCNLFNLPMCFRSGSFAQGPIGTANFFSFTLTNPAFLIRSADSSAMRRVLPKASPAASDTRPHSSKMVPSLVPSNDFGTTLCSSCSIQPPGLRFLIVSNTSLKTQGTHLYASA